MSKWQEEHVTSSNGASIETRVLPGNVEKLAFVAHPLGRLGGNLHDLIVQSLARLLAEQPHGYTVVLMNARGVGSSTGSSSFRWGRRDTSHQS